MEEITLYIQQNAAIAPYLIFGLLLLAGFNIPVSEDLMLFISAMLAAQSPDLLWPLFIAVFAGAYLSDLICYAFMGRYLGNKIFHIKFFQNMVTQEQIDKIHAFYEKYGILTLLIGRFIPFGVRNGLFLTAGLGKMNAVKFAVSDFIACIISSSVFFYLYFTFGEQMVELVKKGNIVLFGLFLIGITVFMLRKKKKTV